MRCGQKNPTTTNQASHGIEWVDPANESLADLRDGGREAKGKKRIGWDSSRREKPLGTRCHRGCACGALLSVYIDHKLGVASLGASPKKLVVFWKSHPIAWPQGRCFGHRGCPARLGRGESLGTAAGGPSPFSEL